MGSKISKAIRPRAKPAVSVAPTSNHYHNIDDTNETPRQDPATQHGDLNVATARVPLSCDDLSIATSTARPQNNLQRRNSEPSRSVSSEPTRSMEQTLLSSFEQFLAERQLANIDWEAVAPTQTPQCLICCTNLPQAKSVNRTKEVIKPCRSCNSEYCVSCVKKMFNDACKDIARMPPRCCVPINLHHVRPHLTKEEANLFRMKYEEWSTPKPFYCPVPVCSTFIPDRLLPQHVKDKQRADSGIGTPTLNEFACPTCEAGICMECRQPAHPGSICSIHEFGLDEETAALLKSWGYKKCPKCGHGLKRMFGCNHMECRCGAHFCWVCMRNMDQCDGGCYDDEDYDDDDESDEDSNISDDDGDATVDDAITPVAGEQTATVEAASQTTATDTATPPQNIPLPRNLDGGSARRWEESSLDFGEEPSNEYQDRAWDCHHSFSEYAINFSTALTAHTTDMECVRCWSTIHPKLHTPELTHDKIVPASAGRARNFGVRGGRGLARTRRDYAPPRGLFRADATIGTAPHLTTTISPLSQSVPAREASPMEDVRFSERIVDVYGTVITTTPIPPTRRASSGDASFQLADITMPEASAFSKTASVFDATPPQFNLAHECSSCSILVCSKCRDDAMAVQQAREAKEDERRYAVQRERLEREGEDADALLRERLQREREEADAAMTLDGAADDDEMAPPSIFD